MKRLPAVMPIARARMMVRVHPAGGSAERPSPEGLVAALRAAGAQPRAATGAGAAAASEGSGVEAFAGDEGASGVGLDFLIEPDTFQKVTRAPGLRGGVPCEEVAKGGNFSARLTGSCPNCCTTAGRSRQRSPRQAHLSRLFRWR